MPQSRRRYQGSEEAEGRTEVMGVLSPAQPDVRVALMPNPPRRLPSAPAPTPPRPLNLLPSGARVGFVPPDPALPLGPEPPAPSPVGTGAWHTSSAAPVKAPAAPVSRNAAAVSSASAPAKAKKPAAPRSALTPPDNLKERGHYHARKEAQRAREREFERERERARAHLASVTITTPLPQPGPAQTTAAAANANQMPLPFTLPTTTSGPPSSIPTQRYAPPAAPPSTPSGSASLPTLQPPLSQAPVTESSHSIWGQILSPILGLRRSSEAPVIPPPSNPTPPHPPSPPVSHSVPASSSTSIPAPLPPKPVSRGLNPKDHRVPPRRPVDITLHTHEVSRNQAASSKASNAKSAAAVQPRQYARNTARTGPPAPLTRRKHATSSTPPAAVRAHQDSRRTLPSVPVSRRSLEQRGSVASVSDVRAGNGSRQVLVGPLRKTHSARPLPSPPSPSSTTPLYVPNSVPRRAEATSVSLPPRRSVWDDIEPEMHALAQAEALASQQRLGSEPSASSLHSLGWYETSLAAPAYSRDPPPTWVPRSPPPPFMSDSEATHAPTSHERALPAQRVQDESASSSSISSSALCTASELDLSASTDTSSDADDANDSNHSLRLLSPSRRAWEADRRAGLGLEERITNELRRSQEKGTLLCNTNFIVDIESLSIRIHNGISGGRTCDDHHRVQTREQVPRGAEMLAGAGGRTNKEDAMEDRDYTRALIGNPSHCRVRSPAPPGAFILDSASSEEADEGMPSTLAGAHSCSSLNSAEHAEDDDEESSEAESSSAELASCSDSHSGLTTAKGGDVQDPRTLSSVASMLSIPSRREHPPVSQNENEEEDWQGSLSDAQWAAEIVGLQGVRAHEFQHLRDAADLYFAQAQESSSQEGSADEQSTPVRNRTFARPVMEPRSHVTSVTGLGDSRNQGNSRAQQRHDRRERRARGAEARAALRAAAPEGSWTLPEWTVDIPKAPSPIYDQQGVNRVARIAPASPPTSGDDTVDSSDSDVSLPLDQGSWSSSPIKSSTHHGSRSQGTISLPVWTVDIPRAPLPIHDELGNNRVAS